MTPKITFPYWGNYTLVFEKLMTRLNLEYIAPEETNQETIRDGAKISPELFCFPLKVNLGNYLKAIRQGANTILMWENVKGICRLRYYWLVQEKVLKDAGYDIKVINLNAHNVLSRLREVSPKSLSLFKFLKIFLRFWQEAAFIENLEKKFWHYLPREKQKGDSEKVFKAALTGFREDKSYINFLRFKKATWRKFSQIEIKPKQDILKVGLIGEIYMVSDGRVNFEMEKKLGEMGIEVHRDLNLTKHLLSSFFWQEQSLKRKIRSYLKSDVGGHGREAIAEMLDYGKKGFDGIIQLLPFGCFVKDTNITIENYLQKPIQDIKIGEQVLTHKGRFKKVTKTFCRNYQGQILKIDCGGKLLTLSLTPEHPVLLAKSSFRGKKRKGIQKLNFIPALEARKGDFIALPIPKEIKELKHFILEKEYKRNPKWEDIRTFSYSPELLRMIGYWLAEGSIRYDSCDNQQSNKKYVRGLAFHFASKEKEYINDVADIINRNFKTKISEYYRPDRPTDMELYIGNRNLGEIVLSLCGEYCDRKSLHNNLTLLEPSSQRELLKGFFRGDGCLTDKYGETSYRAVTTSWNLASQLFWLLARNRIKSSLMEQNIKDRKISYMLKIATASEIERLEDERIKLTQRKRFIKHRELDDYFLLPIKKIKAADFKSKVYNLEVEDDHSYVANFLAVHNCMPEVTVRPILQKISNQRKMPFLSISLDEQTGEAGLLTRLEAFVDLMKSKKKLAIKQI